MITLNLVYDDIQIPLVCEETQTLLEVKFSLMDYIDMEFNDMLLFLEGVGLLDCSNEELQLSNLALGKY